MTVSSIVELLRFYHNSFDRNGLLKWEYDNKINPTVPPVQHSRRKLPIKSMAVIKEATEYMVKQDILQT